MSCKQRTSQNISRLQCAVFSTVQFHSYSQVPLVQRGPIDSTMFRLLSSLFLVGCIGRYAANNQGSCPSTSLDGCKPSKVEALEPFRIRNEPGQPMTTDQGIPMSNNRDSLKAGPRGPTLLEDFQLREKIMSFDHERIPERIVHARGSGAYGTFTTYKSFSQYTRAKFLSSANKRTPVFVRFSTVAGSLGSADTVRDIRGFALKFYTEEGNHDIVGNNAPVFFVQDAMRFPDFVHSVKPEPHNDIPQASSAHDNLWDFVAEQTETMHAIMWAMSDRAIPRSLTTMQGFGVHTFRLINATGHSVLIKWHLKSLQGVYSLVWDEAQKLAGKNADFHRADLWEMIEKGIYPEWELGIQIVNEDSELGLGYDILDPTKLIPEERAPIIPLGKLVLNRNPDNFFAETEQIAFDVANIVPGVDMTNDPLLQGRAFSYLDTQLSRLGGPNFHEIPINRPLCGYRNNKRDGQHRQAVHVGKTNYFRNTNGGGLPDVTADGFVSFPQLVNGTKIRQSAASFADHFSQANLFWVSMSSWEQDHIVSAFSFELAKVAERIRRKVVGNLQAVNETLAARVAANLGVTLGPVPFAGYPKRVNPSRALSQASLTVDNVRGRRVAILAANGTDGAAIRKLMSTLNARQIMTTVVASSFLRLRSSTGGADITPADTVSGAPSILYDALFIPGGASAVAALQADGVSLHYVQEAFGHLKPIATSGDGWKVLEKAGVVSNWNNLPDGLIVERAASLSDAFINRFIGNIRMHRFYARNVSSIPY